MYEWSVCVLYVSVCVGVCVCAHVHAHWGEAGVSKLGKGNCLLMRFVFIKGDTYCDDLAVCVPPPHKFICWNPHPQSDSIRK